MTKILQNNTPLSIGMTIVNVFVFFLHTTGLFLLINMKILNPTVNNDAIVCFTNTTLLMMLSACEMAASFTISIERIIYFIKPSKKMSSISSIFHAFGLQISIGISVSTMFLITLNRLLSCVYPMWYRRRLTKKKFAGFATMVSVFTALGTSFKTLMMCRAHSKSSFMIPWVIMDFVYSFYFGFCVFTYVLILVTIAKSRRNVQSDDNDSTSSIFQFIVTVLKERGYVAPFFITLTYLMFVIAPCIAISVRPVSASFIVFIVTFVLNNISDAIIYIFFDRDIRQYLKKVFSRGNVIDSR